MPKWAASADPTGVFVLRNEPEEVAKQVLGRDFVIRDGDTLYVTEAPFTQWSKVITAITGTASSAASVTSLTSGG